jgi:hypothetical protein
LASRIDEPAYLDFVRNEIMKRRFLQSHAAALGVAVQRADVAAQRQAELKRLEGEAKLQQAAEQAARKEARQNALAPLYSRESKLTKQYMLLWYKAPGIGKELRNKEAVLKIDVREMHKGTLGCAAFMLVSTILCLGGGALANHSKETMGFVAFAIASPILAYWFDYSGRIKPGLAEVAKARTDFDEFSNDVADLVRAAKELDEDCRKLDGPKFNDKICYTQLHDLISYDGAALLRRC